MLEYWKVVQYAVLLDDNRRLNKQMLGVAGEDDLLIYGMPL